jgi:hypothetical protein
LPRKKSPSDVVLRRLAEGALPSLARVVVDDLLARPLAELVDADWTARQILTALGALSEGPDAEASIRRRLGALREHVPTGTAGARLPEEIRRPLRDVVARPYLPDRALVGRLLDHAAMQRLLRDVLVGALQSFVAKLKAPVPARFSRLKALGGKALHEGVLGGLSHEIERQAEARIRDFVDGAVHTFVAQVADHVTSPEHAERYAEFRAHLLDTLLDTELAVFAGEMEKLHPDEVVATAAATARALARRSGLQGEIAAAIRAAIEASGERSLGDLVAEAGLAEGWRAEAEAQLVEQMGKVVETTAFRRWLERLLEAD